MTVRVGIIGTGIMGSDHARLLGTAVSGGSLVAVSDVDTSRAAAVAARHPGVRVLADPLELVRDGGVDAVLIASSDQTHEEYVLACLAAAKPVLCEKPLAPGVAGCRRILDAETAHGRRLVTVGFMRRYDPGYVDMKQALDSGRIGAPLLLHCVHRNPAAPAGLPSAAVITNSAVHELDLTRWLLGEEIASVTVHTPRRATVAGGTQDPQFLVVESVGGVLVSVEVFVNARYGYDVRCELVGEEGTVTLDAPPATLLRHGTAAARALPVDWRPRFAEAYRRELQDWVDALGTGRAPAGASAWDGYAATVAAQAGVAALESGTPQKVELDPRPALYR
ncbi:MAG: myo-inositol 2-dehydrogenase / D-chiro-inositol 1-dehydrogenase [Micromonosporaceae bacterium]